MIDRFIVLCLVIAGSFRTTGFLTTFSVWRFNCYSYQFISDVSPEPIDDEVFLDLDLDFDLVIDLALAIEATSSALSSSSFSSLISTINFWDPANFSGRQPHAHFFYYFLYFCLFHLESGLPPGSPVPLNHLALFSSLEIGLSPLFVYYELSWVPDVHITSRVLFSSFPECGV